MQDFVTAIGLVLVIEGILYGGFPAAMKRMAEQLLEIDEQTMRYIGLIAITFGVLVVWLARS